ncbi:hypothetical protein ACGFZR_15290 [Streptomyces sp. NPDC048241]|uniref:hypothetical protein n=1 Tax=Streptomyces sp. NPDC048241 TaxID=3365521 RepID=UPI003723CF83
MSKATPGPQGTEMRWATLPDGTRMLISTKRGMSQDEVDLLAAKLWRQTKS